MTTFSSAEQWAPPAKSGAPECCRDARNLVTIQTEPHVDVRQCRECGRKHYRAKVDMSGKAGVRIGG